jgi:DNA-binding NtrC family response regulator
LFYRLHVFPVDIPCLRERVEDIPLLVEYFIDRYAREAGKNIRSVDKKTLQLLQSYSWPGNIHELQNVIERSVIVCETENSSVDESWLSQKPPQRRRVANVLQLLKRLAHHRVFPQPARKLIPRRWKRCFISTNRTCWNKV